MRLSFRFTLVACKAGIMPKNKALRSETPKPASRMRPLICTVILFQTIPDATLVMTSSDHRAATKPRLPPRRNSRVLSVTSWRIIRPREQPKADRTATSLKRFTLRARSKLATFAQAIRSTTPAATAVIHKPSSAFRLVGPGWRNVSAKSSTIRWPLRSVVDRAPLKLWAMLSASVRAWSRVAPDFSRATIRTLAVPATLNVPLFAYDSSTRGA